MNVPAEDPIDIEAVVREAIESYPREMQPPELEAKLQAYLHRLAETNTQINLVSRRETAKHLARFTRESLFLARLLREERRTAGPDRKAHVLDIGSGGGFPGIVLKLAIPDLEIHLVEATRKKARFLADVAAGLDLRATSVVWGRSEDLTDAKKPSYKKEMRHRFDWVTGKGLGKLRDSTELAEPFLRAGGIHWTFKGKTCREELDAAGGLFRQRGFAPYRVEPIPGSNESWVVGIRRLGA